MSEQHWWNWSVRWSHLNRKKFVSGMYCNALKFILSFFFFFIWCVLELNTEPMNQWQSKLNERITQNCVCLVNYNAFAVIRALFRFVHFNYLFLFFFYLFSPLLPAALFPLLLNSKNGTIHRLASSVCCVVFVLSVIHSIVN